MSPTYKINNTIYSKSLAWSTDVTSCPKDHVIHVKCVQWLYVSDSYYIIDWLIGLWILKKRFS
jgi:hypothetical protein